MWSALGVGFLPSLFAYKGRTAAQPVRLAHRPGLYLNRLTRGLTGAIRRDRALRPARCPGFSFL